MPSVCGIIGREDWMDVPDRGLYPSVFNLAPEGGQLQS